MKKLRDIIKEAENKKAALGHFNISDIVALKAIFEAARELGVPVLIGTSEGEREFIGPKQAVDLVRSLSGEFDYPIFINADHTHSLDKIEEAARAGYDEILFDGSKLDFEENARQTKRAVEIIKSVNPEIVVEGEIGYIGSASEVMEKRPEGIELTSPEEAAQFVKETGVDVLAPAVGNMHGLLESMVEGEVKKRLNIGRIEKIKKAVKIPLTLHGGSGTADEDFRAAIKAGVNIIHVSTELRVAWRRSLEEELRKNPTEVAPYKILPSAFQAIKGIVSKRLKLFSGL